VRRWGGMLVVALLVGAPPSAAAGGIASSSGRHESPAVDQENTLFITHETLVNEVEFSIDGEAGVFVGTGVVRYRHAVSSEICEGGSATFHTTFTFTYEGSFDPISMGLEGRYLIATPGTEQDASCPRHGYQHVFEPLEGEWLGFVDLSTGRIRETRGRFGVVVPLSEAALAILGAADPGAPSPPGSDPTDTTGTSVTTLADVGGGPGGGFPGWAVAAAAGAVLAGGAGGVALIRRRSGPLPGEGWGRPERAPAGSPAGARGMAAAPVVTGPADLLRSLRDRARLLDVMSEDALNEFMADIDAGGFDRMGGTPLRSRVERAFATGGAPAVTDLFERYVEEVEALGGWAAFDRGDMPRFPTPEPTAPTPEPIEPDPPERPDDFPEKIL
jgi:hypothetical protein